MKVKIYGLVTGKIFAQGEKNDCIRELQSRYPDFSRGIKKEIVNNPVYDEPLAIKLIKQIRHTAEKRQVCRRYGRDIESVIGRNTQLGG